MAIDWEKKSLKEVESVLYEVAEELDERARKLRAERKYKRAREMELIAAGLRDATRCLFNSIRESRTNVAGIIKLYGWLASVLDDAFRMDDALVRKYSYLLDLIPEIIANAILDEGNSNGRGGYTRCSSSESRLSFFRLLEC